MKKWKYSCLLLLVSCISASAQEVLPFDEALDSVLARHYNIQVANLSVDQAENNKSILNSGYLPTLTANGNSSVSYFEGENRTVQGNAAFDPAESYNYGASLSLNYTVFNGRRAYNFKQLKEQYNLSTLQARQVVEQSVLEFSTAYYELALRYEQNLSLARALRISKDRLTRAKYNYEYGQGTQLDVLNAEVDFNGDSINYRSNLRLLNNAKHNINFMLARDIETPFSVDTTVALGLDKTQETLLEAALNKNVQIALTKSQLQNSEWALKQSKTGWLPQLDFNASYNYSGSENPNGAFLIGNYIAGPQAGLTLSWNLFDGGRTNVAVKNNKLSVESAAIAKNQAELEVRRSLLNAYNSYQDALFVFQSQKTNLLTNQRNFKRSEELYKQGQITSIEFRQAQLNLINAQASVSQAKYNAKNAELQVKQLAGILLSE